MVTRGNEPGMTIFIDKGGLRYFQTADRRTLPPEAGPVARGGIVESSIDELLGQINSRPHLARHVALDYRFTPAIQAAWSAFQGSIASLLQSQGLWQLTSQISVVDRKHNAGAAALDTRESFQRGQFLPAAVRANLPVAGLRSGFFRAISFLPDCLMFEWPDGVAGLLYTGLIVTAQPTAFVESEWVPSDAALLRYTWQYVNKDGGQDLRFMDNRQLPVMQYGQLTLEGPDGFILQWHVSSLEAAQRFVQGLNSYVGVLTSPAPLPPTAELRCAVCGEPLEAGENFCPNCGTAVEGGTGEQPTRRFDNRAR